MENEYLEEKKEKKGKLFGYIFIFWFICSFVAFFLIEDPYYIVMNFGQYFVVFGLIAFFNMYGWEKLISMPFIIVGLCCITIPYLMLHPELIPTSVDWNTVIAVLALCGFLIAGLCTVIIPIKRRNYLKRVCTYEVDATITGYDTTRSDKGNTLYAPIYSFWYNGQTREIVSNVYTNVGLKKVGEKVTFKINPDNFCEYFNEKSKGYLIVACVGVLVICFILPLLIYVLKNGVVG